MKVDGVGPASSYNLTLIQSLYFLTHVDMISAPLPSAISTIYFVPHGMNYYLTCFNDAALSWEESYENLILARSENFIGPLTCSDVIKRAKVVETTNAIPIQEILTTISHQETNLSVLRMLL